MHFMFRFCHFSNMKVRGLMKKNIHKNNCLISINLLKLSQIQSVYVIFTSPCIENSINLDFSTPEITLTATPYKILCKVFFSEIFRSAS